MNCIFCCVFTHPKYVDMFYMLLESILIYGELDDNTHILVYTTTQFMNLIKQNHLFEPEKIKFEINDNYTTIEQACKSRINLFNLQSVKNYNKILYLDTDIIVKDNLNHVFDLCTDDILYTLEESNIYPDKHDYHGRSLFTKEELDSYQDKSAFTSGILLFKNVNKIKELFDDIIEDMIKRPRRFECHDQPYIVYNAFKHKIFDNKILKKYVVNNDNNIHSTKTIHHFPGGPGFYINKLTKMNTFLKSMKDHTINININKAKEYINKYLLPIIKNSGEKHEGNIFMLHNTTVYSNTYLNKAKNISNLLLNKNIKNVMEIGFNSGFSTLLMLLTNPNIRMNCFDLGEHAYTRPCYEKIKETFGDRVTITFGDSTETLKSVNNKYDLIHIDGGHSVDVATIDIENAYRLSKPRTILIMDDYDFPRLHTLWDSYVAKYKLSPLKIHLYNSKHHDVKYVSS